MKNSRGKISKAKQRADEEFSKGFGLVQRHPLFEPLAHHASINRSVERNICPEDGWAVVAEDGVIHTHPLRQCKPEEWAFVIAHCLLHLGFEHFRKTEQPRMWNAACDVFADRFLQDLKFGLPPEEMRSFEELPRRSEEKLYEEFCRGGLPQVFDSIGTAGHHPDMIIFGQDIKASTKSLMYFRHAFDWKQALADGLSRAVSRALDIAAGRETALWATWDTPLLTTVQKARGWFMSSYPLLGSLAASFSLVEDRLICAKLNISVAAVDVEARQVLVNPAAGLDFQEALFVLAHELLHVGLRHDKRCTYREPWLWNIACDFVINGWLVEMGIGELPRLGVLYDPSLKGESAEGVYDRIVTDIRTFRKLATLRGVGLGDILGGDSGRYSPVGTDLDAFYRNAISQGLLYHQDQGRGILPAGLTEEIRALAQPAIPWDVELANWFDGYFAPLEKRRSFARPSRRQSACPTIPLPRWIPVAGAQDGRTFGVVLDTSGSMDRKILGKALGAIAEFAMARDVPAVRVIFCDTVAYDAGYLPPEGIAQTVKIKGRGGTILQPAIDLLERAADFPTQGPILIITDGQCDRLHVRRSHAFLLPEGRHLPFVPKGPVFRITGDPG
ncbi:MAG: peptidase [Candidatus Ozemobacteraceae bacterium]